MSNLLKSHIRGVVFFSLKKFSDERGWLVELFREDQLFADHFPAMAYVSQTEPGVSRGPHLHHKQTDLFCFIGPGDFELHLWEQFVESRQQGHSPYHEIFVVGEQQPVAVLIPPGIVHAYRNISDKPGWVFNAPNQLYKGPGGKYPVDEIRFEDDKNNPYQFE